jgi:hypothetical protein
LFVALVLGSHGVEALSVKVEKVFGVVFGAGVVASLKAGAGRGAAEAGCGCDKLHHLQCDLFVATEGWSRRNGRNSDIAHGDSPGWNKKTPRASSKGDAVPMITEKQI